MTPSKYIEKIRNIWVAAAMKASGKPYHGLLFNEATGFAMFKFEFKDAKDYEESVNAYWNKEINVDALTLADAFRYLKGQVIDYRNGNVHEESESEGEQEREEGSHYFGAKRLGSRKG